MSAWTWTLIAVFVLWIGGCAPSRKVTAERTLGVEEVMRRVHERNAKIETLAADGTITVESPEASGSGSFDLNLRKPDSLLVEFNGPFGIRVGTLALSRDRFVFYNAMENTATIGKPDGKTFASLFRLRLHFDEVISAFTGEFATSAENDSLARFYVEDNRYVVKYNDGGITKEYRIDGDRFVVTSYREIGAGGKVTLTAIAEELEETDDIPMPRLIRIILPVERRSVTVAYDDIHFNTPVECSFSLPAKAEVINR